MSAPVPGLPFPALQSLLAPVEAAAFFGSHWERQPLLVRSHGGSARGQLVRPDWRELLRSAAGEATACLELLRPSRYEKLGELAGAERALAEGLSLRVYNVERVWPELARLCVDLAQELGFAVAANLYVTPAGCQGLGAHSDDHDVFVVQVAAGKDWRVYGSPFALPLEHRSPLIFEARGVRRDNRGAPYGAHPHAQAEQAAPALRATLEPGDLLYLPRGAVHWATASGGTSAHVTIGVHATTWADLAALAVARAARERPGLRETLPPGATRAAPDAAWLSREIEERTSGLFGGDAALDALEELAARFLAQGGGEEAGAAPAEAGAASHFDSETEFSLTRNVLIVRRGDTLALRRFRPGSDDVLLPAAFTAAIEEMRKRERFRLGELETLSPRSALVLGRELHRRGLLSPAR